MLPVTTSFIEGDWYQKDVVVFLNSFLNVNNEDRVRMLKKLMEISNLVRSSHADQVEKVTGWGLGCKRKLDISTHIFLMHSC